MRLEQIIFHQAVPELHIIKNLIVQKLLFIIEILNTTTFTYKPMTAQSFM